MFPPGNCKRNPTVPRLHRHLQRYQALPRRMYLPGLWGNRPKRALETRDQSGRGHLLEPVNTRKEDDCEQEDQTHIAGRDRNGGSFRRDGFSAATAQERGPDWRLQRTLQRHAAVQRCLLLRAYQWSKPWIVRFRSTITKSPGRGTQKHGNRNIPFGQKAIHCAA